MQSGDNMGGAGKIEASLLKSFVPFILCLIVRYNDVLILQTSRLLAAQVKRERKVTCAGESRRKQYSEEEKQHIWDLEKRKDKMEKYE